MQNSHTFRDHEKLTTIYWLKIVNFPIPLYFNALVQSEPFQISGRTFYRKPRLLGLFISEDFVILACVILTQCQHVTDRQTDRQTS